MTSGAETTQLALNRLAAAAALGLSLSTFDRLRARGELPKPRLVTGASSPRWLADELRAWLRDRPVTR